MRAERRRPTRRPVPPSPRAPAIARSTSSHHAAPLLLQTVALLLGVALLILFLPRFASEAPDRTLGEHVQALEDAERILDASLVDARTSLGALERDLQDARAWRDDARTLLATIVREHQTMRREHARILARLAHQSPIPREPDGPHGWVHGEGDAP